MAEGRIVTGLITAKNDRMLTIRTHQQKEELSLRCDEIEEMKTLTTSLMPEGLLQGMNNDGIRDLI